MLLPIRTDAAVGGRIHGTVGLIAVNVFVAFAFGFPEAVDATGVLQYGRFNPLSWITNGFLHMGWAHLIFNMVFLWTFGLAVESLVGWRRFLAMYGAILLVEGALTQLIMLGAEDGGAVGASGAIMGLLAIACQWSPRNKFDTLIGMFPIVFWRVELGVTTLAAILFGLDLFGWMLGGFQMGTAMLHIIGAAAGATIGYVMLRKRLVECDGWDLYSILEHGTPSYRSQERERKREPEPEPEPDMPVDPRVAALVRVRDALDAGDAQMAHNAYAQSMAMAGHWQLPPADRERLIEALRRAGHHVALSEHLGTGEEPPAPPPTRQSGLELE